MIDDWQLAEAISVPFTVLSTLSVVFGSLDMSHQKMADGGGILGTFVGAPKLL
jgi:hypothetical protein